MRRLALVPVLALLCACTAAAADAEGHPLDPTEAGGNVDVAVGPQPPPATGPALPDAMFLGPRETCLRRDGELTCYGGTFGEEPFVRREPELRDAVRIALGWVHLCAVMRDGRVACRGFNTSGQLGLGAEVERSDELRVVPGVTGAVDVAVDMAHSCALTAAGEAWCWGGNRFGEVGDGSVDRTPPWVRSAGSPPVRMAFAGVRAVGVGSNHTCVLLAQGEVRCVGYDQYGQLGDGSAGDGWVALPPARAIAVAGNSSCALTVDGDVYCWGRNTEGQLGARTEEECSVVVGHPCAREPVRVEGVAGIERIAFGGVFGCALDAAGDLSCWGSNVHGALGDPAAGPTQLARLTGWDVLDYAVGSEHACALGAGGTLRCWGRGGEGQLVTGALEDAAVPVEARP